MIVLDSSAVVALYLKEPGAELVKPAMPMALLSTVNYAEILARFERDKKNSSQSIALPLRQSVREVVPFDFVQAITASLLIDRTKRFGLSLGDRCCLALAMERKCAVLTADRIWLQLGLPIEIRLIR